MLCTRPPSLSLPPTTAPDHPQSFPTPHQGLQLRSQWHGQLRSHAYCRQLGEEGSAKLARFIGCDVPRQRTLRPPAGAKGTERMLSSLLSAAVRIRISEFKKLHDVLEKLHLLCCSNSVGAASLIQQREALLDQPRQAVENPPYVCRISSFTEPQIIPTEAACKFGGVYFSIECPFARNAHPGTLSALQALQPAR